MRSRKHKPLVPSYLGPFALEIYRRGDLYHSFAFLQATIIIVCAAEVLSLSCYDIGFESCVFVFFSSSLVHPAQDGCVREASTDGLDLIFTDIMGLMILAMRSGPDYSLHKYKHKNVVIVFRSKDHKSFYCA